MGAVAVALLIATGVLPLGSKSSSEEAVSYSQATAVAHDVLPAGFTPTGILTAVGVDARSGETLSATGFVNNTTKNCTFQQLPGYPPSGQMTVPSYSGSFDSGLAPFWLIVYVNTTARLAVIVTVVGATAAALGQLSGATCGGTGTTAKTLPADVVDSPAAAGAAWGLAASYANGNANVTALTMAAYGGATTGLVTSPFWVFLYAPCSALAGGTVKSPALTVLLGLTDVSTSYSSTTSLNCPG